MPPIRPILTKRNIIIGSRRQRIRIPQPPDRPFRLTGRDVLRREAIRQDPWWFTTHRRGVYRPLIGADPLEARAVQGIKGTLPERIVYRNLISFRLVPDIDFDFQSSLFGGRMELGGIVADFILPLKRIVIRIQGPTHETGLRIAKDQEQLEILEHMGYWVVDITDQQVYDHMYLIEWTRRLLGYGKWGGGEICASVHATAGGEIENEAVELIVNRLPIINTGVDNLEAGISIWRP